MSVAACTISSTPPHSPCDRGALRVGRTYREVDVAVEDRREWRLVDQRRFIREHGTRGTCDDELDYVPIECPPGPSILHLEEDQKKDITRQWSAHCMT